MAMRPRCVHRVSSCISLRHGFAMRRYRGYFLFFLNRTEEAAPGSPPRDLTIRYKDDTLLLSWRAPKYPNGGVNGYVIQYTVDRRAEDREWFVEAVVGDVTSAVIRNVEPETKYFFKMSARNNKGYGPSGSIITYTTGRAGKSRNFSALRA